MLAGAVDPLEGSLVVLFGSGAVALGTFLGGGQRGRAIYRLVVFGLIGFGVGAMYGLSALGGIGGRSELPMWWVLLIIPYPVGWIMGMVNLMFELVKATRPERTNP